MRSTFRERLYRIEPDTALQIHNYGCNRHDITTTDSITLYHTVDGKPLSLGGVAQGTRPLRIATPFNILADSNGATVKVVSTTE